MTLGGWNFGNASPIGISDDQVLEEHKAEQRLQAAIAEMRRAIHEVNKNSAVVEIEPSAFDDFLRDESPDHDYWLEKIAAARAI